MEDFLEESLEFVEPEYNLFNNKHDQLDKLFDGLSNYIGHGLFYLFRLAYPYIRLFRQEKKE